MIDYISSSSDTLSGSGGAVSAASSATRVRTVRLVRPPGTSTLPPPGLTCRHGPGLGFSIRGGREHGTGFFVSSVEVGSEAHRQGLKVGDQIIRVNGFTVEDAVHKEVLQLISNHTHLTLKVRSVGMIPVKDRSTDPLSWQIIPDFGSILSESPPLEDKHHDVRISIAVAQRAKLGCGICKGPEWKPGIFVQFTKEGGIARDAGLRPGDQILYCNNVDFTDISFNEARPSAYKSIEDSDRDVTKCAICGEILNYVDKQTFSVDLCPISDENEYFRCRAVNIMKTSRQLDLVVRKGAGSELFPGESSGYNSSASSVTGDQSPSWSESKRLSIVKEESLELEDRLSHLDFQRYKPKSWEKISYDWDENPRHFKPTIINLSENGTTIKNNGTVEECQNNLLEETEVEKDKPSTKLADICLVSQQHETKTVVVEVHRSDLEDNEKIDELKKSPSSASYASSVSRSSTASSSLSSAISMELQRRSERNKEAQKKLNIDEEIQKKKILKGVDSDKKHQHDKLMDEFRKAHRKMFNSTIDDDDSSKEDQPEKQIKNEKEFSKDRQMNSQLSQRRSTIATPEEASERLAPLVNSSGGPAFPVRTPATTVQPPPPPPMPSIDSDTNAKPKPSSKPKAPPVPQKTFQQPIPPPCPTPDYDTLSIRSTASSGTLPRQTPPKPPSPPGSKDCVDMESLESFKLNNPGGPKPKPPSTYFNKPKLTGQMSSPPATTLKKQRPVSVTIGEYPSGTNKRTPTKFEFLNSMNGDTDQVDSPQNQPIASRFASELAQTLSRSNLRRRTENSENMANGSIKPLTNGTVTISVNNDKLPFANGHSHKPLTKSQSTDVCSTRNIESLTKGLANRVTIKISDSDANREVPSSILKNGNGNHCSSQHKPLVHQKSITFGEM